MSAPWSLVEILPDEPKTLVEGEAREWSISPSATSTWLECERKWGFVYIGKMRAPAKASALLGTDGHTQAEAFLGKGTPLDFSRPSGAIMQAGQHLWPAIGTPGMTLERKFRFRSTRTGFIYSGLKDIEIAPGAPQPQLGFDGLAPIVLDHKTTKSINDYAKTEEELEYDPQSTLYGLDAMARYRTVVVDLGWLYYQTQGGKRVHPVMLRAELAHTLRVFGAIEAEAEKMAEKRTAFASSSQQATPIAFVKENFKANPAACRSFGGCPYEHICNLSPTQRMRSRVSMGIIDDLKSRVQGTSVPMVTMAEAPPKPMTQEPLFGDPTQLPAPTEIPAAFRSTGINPPESQLPPPPLVPAEKPEPQTAEGETKPKTTRGRPAGSKNKVKEEPAAAPSTAAEPAAAPVFSPKLQEALDKSMHLYVDCLPDGASFVTYADVLVAKANDKIVAGGAVAHYKFLKFGEAAGALAIALGEVLDDEKPGAVFVNATSEALPILTARATVITRSVR